MSGNAASTPLHVVGRFDDPHTGAERSLPDLAQALQGMREVALWSDVPVHPYFSARGVRQMVDGAETDAVDGGTLLISGIHVALGGWLDRLRPDRIMLRYNLPDHQRLFDAIGKHDPQDVAIYRMLAARRMRVRIMGGTCLAPRLGGVAGIDLLPSGNEPAARFLRSLDIFFYRTGSFVEPYGRVVLEAMASGLPVVASDSGGYAEQIDNGVDGVIVQTQEQALQALRLLAAQPEMRHQLGTAARNRAIALHGPQAIARLVSNYCA